MATGYSKSMVGGSDSFRGSFTLGSDETFDFFCSPCDNRDNSKVEAEFYCSVCDDFCCQPCTKVHNSFKGNRSHPVYGRDQKDKWGVQIQSAMLPTEVCPDHAEESLKMVCLNHSKLCCSVCVSLHHRACPEMVYVPKIAKDITKSEELSIVSQTINQFIQLIDEMIKSDKKTQTSLDKSQTDYLENIKEIKRQVNDYFTNLEKSAINEMNIFHNGKKDLLQQNLKSLDDSKVKLTVLQTAIQPSSSHNESQLFIEMFKANEQLPEFQHNLQKLSQAPQTTSFHLNPNPQLQQLLATITNLGEMKVDTAVMKRKLPKIPPLPLLSVKQPSLPIEELNISTGNTPKQQSNTNLKSSPGVGQTSTTSVPAHKAQQQKQQQQQPQQLQQKLYNSSNERDINVKMKSDKISCKVNGICQMSNGDILLTDYTNNKVKRLNTNYEPTDYLDLPASPNAICCMGDTEAAVTDCNNTIHFLSMTRSKMSVTRSMKLDHYCYGIAHHNGRLFVSDWNNKVYIYTTSGKCLKTVQTDNTGADIFSNTCHICVSPDGSKIYVADWYRGLVILDIEGSHIYTYSSCDLSYACGVCVDSQGRVLVCGFDSSNVLQLEEGGRLVGQVVGRGDGIDSPQSICVDTHHSTLIVSMYHKDCIKVFDLK